MTAAAAADDDDDDDTSSSENDSINGRFHSVNRCLELLLDEQSLNMQLIAVT